MFQCMTVFRKRNKNYKGFLADNKQYERFKLLRNITIVNSDRGNAVPLPSGAITPELVVCEEHSQKL